MARLRCKLAHMTVILYTCLALLKTAAAGSQPAHQERCEHLAAHPAQSRPSTIERSPPACTGARCVCIAHLARARPLHNTHHLWR